MMNTQLKTIIDNLFGIPKYLGMPMYPFGEAVPQENITYHVYGSEWTPRMVANKILKGERVPFELRSFLKSYFIYYLNSPKNWMNAINENELRKEIFKIYASYDAVSMVEDFVKHHSGVL